MVALNDPSTVKSLRYCGFLKYFRLLGMRQHMELLLFLIRSCDLELHKFHIGDKVLPMLFDDIYFFTGL